MRKLTVALIVLLGLPTLVCAATPAPIFDQIGPDNSAVAARRAMSASQEFEPAHAAGDLANVDAFTIPAAAGPQRLTSADAVVGFFDPSSATDFGRIQYYGLYIYSSVAASAASLTGDVASAIVPPSAATVTAPFFSYSYPNGLVSLDLTPYDIVLAPGTYYMAVVPRMDRDPYGQTGVVQSGLGANDGSFVTEPNDPFGGRVASSVSDGGAAYRLTTVAVPEPAIPLLFMSAFAFRRRR